MKKNQNKEVGLEELLEEFKNNMNVENIKGMARFGINSEGTFGVPIPWLRKKAKEIGKNHKLALELWETGLHEPRILASMIADHKVLDEETMEKWVNGFDSWDVCDQVCMNLFDKTEYAVKKAIEWAERDEEFVKRAGFALMASLAFHSKTIDNSTFEKFFPFIIKASDDNRNFVKKAVNWALRQIGKKNKYLNKKSIETAEYILKYNQTKSAQWIAKDALKELNDEKTLARIKD